MSAEFSRSSLTNESKDENRRQPSNTSKAGVWSFLLVLLNAPALLSKPLLKLYISASLTSEIHFLHSVCTQTSLPSLHKYVSELVRYICILFQLPWLLHSVLTFTMMFTLVSLVNILYFSLIIFDFFLKNILQKCCHGALWGDPSRVGALMLEHH